MTPKRITGTIKSLLPYDLVHWVMEIENRSMLLDSISFSMAMTSEKVRDHNIKNGANGLKVDIYYNGAYHIERLRAKKNKYFKELYRNEMFKTG